MFANNIIRVAGNNAVFDLSQNVIFDLCVYTENSR